MPRKNSSRPKNIIQSSGAPTVQSDRSRFEMYAAFMEGYVKRINAATFNVTIGGVRVGSAKYTRLAQINLQSRVITFSRFAVENVPERGRRYLVLHELAHVKEPSHNKRFWDFVSFWEPEHEKVNHELQNAFRKNIKSEQARINAASRRIAEGASTNWGAPNMMLKSYLEKPLQGFAADYGPASADNPFAYPGYAPNETADGEADYYEDDESSDEDGDWMADEFDEFEEDAYAMTGGSDD